MNYGIPATEIVLEEWIGHRRKIGLAKEIQRLVQLSKSERQNRLLCMEQIEHTLKG